MTEEPRIAVLYHANCADGFGAAYAAWKRFGATPVAYIPCRYGDAADVPASVREIFALDWMPPREQFETWIRQLALPKKDPGRLASVTWIDHHAGVQPYADELMLRRIEGLAVVFGLTRSAAALTWLHFHKGDTIPPLLLYAEDRDLWKWKLPNSREVNARLQTLPHEFSVWNHYAEKPDVLAAEGRGALEVQRREVRMRIKSARTGKLSDFGLTGDETAAVVNATSFMSETGEALLEENPVDVAVLWAVGQDDAIVSFRSRPDGPNVAEIASRHGGGGHEHAAGARITLLQTARLVCPVLTAEQAPKEKRNAGQVRKAETVHGR